jgi:hypothetical protein
MVRDQGVTTPWTKRGSKKRKPAESEFPSLAGFYFNSSLKGGYYVKRTSKMVQRSKRLWIY